MKDAKPGAVPSNRDGRPAVRLADQPWARRSQPGGGAAVSGDELGRSTLPRRGDPTHVPTAPALSAEASAAIDEVDLRALVTELRAQVNQIIETDRQLGVVLDGEHRAAVGEEVIAAWFRGQHEDRIRRGRPALDQNVADRIRDEVRAALSPLGLLTRYLSTTQWSDVEVNGALNVICTQRDTGARREYASPFREDHEAFEWVAEQAAKAGRRFDEANPSVRFRLPNGVRVHAISRVTTHTHLSFRLFPPSLDTFAGLADTGMFGPDVHALLAATAAARAPIGVIFTGGTGAGKTTLLRAWLNAHPDRTVLDRVVTVEDEQELFLDPGRFRNLIEFEARESNVDGKGEYSMERYLSHDLRRQTPQRVGLGELRPDGGVMPLLLALGQGIAQGVATTLHAPAADQVLNRIDIYAATGTQRLPQATVMQTVAAAVDLVVHVEHRDGHRVVATIRELAEYRDGTVTSAELWRYDPGAAQTLRTDLEITDALAAKLVHAGLDPAVLERNRHGRS